jgi:acetolactate synthase small subunit
VHTYELTVNNHPGALAHVVALVAGRRWKLASLSYPEAGGADRRSLVLCLDTEGRSDQVEAQLAKLYDVLSVERLPPA